METGISSYDFGTKLQEVEQEQATSEQEQTTSEQVNTLGNEVSAAKPEPQNVEMKVSGPRLRRWRMTGELMQAVIEGTSGLPDPVDMEELTDDKYWKLIAALNHLLLHEIDSECAQLNKDQIITTMSIEQSPSSFNTLMRAPQVFKLQDFKASIDN